jgi:fructose-bisphosphate aldolase class II
MSALQRFIKEAEKEGRAIGHFNISDSVTLKAIAEAALEISNQLNIKIPVILGTSEGERNFIGPRQAAALIKSYREELALPIFLNADHTHSLEKVKEAALAGYDAILFDPSSNFLKRGAGAGKLSLEENIKQTKTVVDYVKSINPEILLEGEIGYIGAASEILKELPPGAAIQPAELTTPEEAKRFIKETGVELLAPAVGNVHGIIKGGNPKLDIQRLAAIKKAVDIPLVLHGGSGISGEEFVAAIKAGISIIHINTEIRWAWRKGLEQGLRDNPEEIAPYKIYPSAVEEIKKIVAARLKLFTTLKTQG